MKVGAKKSGKDSSERDKKEGGKRSKTGDGKSALTAEDYSDYEVEVDDEDADEQDRELAAGSGGQSVAMKFGRSSKTGNKTVGGSKVREEDLDDSEVDEEAPDASSRARGASPSKRYQAVIDENEEDGNQITDNQSDKQVSPKPTQRARRNRPFHLNSSGASLEEDLTVDYYDEEFNEYDNQDFETSPRPAVENLMDDDGEGGLSEISNEVLYFSSKVTYQRGALFNKNLIL